MFFKPHIDVLDLPCERLPQGFDGLTLLHLSDLHISRWTRRLELWRKALAKLKPHLVVITGDLGHRSWLWKTSLHSVQRLLEPLTPPLGTYFILGNHDSARLGPALAESVDAAGGTRMMLQNQTVFLDATSEGIRVEKPESLLRRAAAAQIAPSSSHPALGHPARLALIGIHQHRRIDTDIPSALRLVSPRDFKLVLLHYPDLVHPAIAAGADICLAGHTHGGQICWPDGQPLFRQDTLPRDMCTGVHRVNGTWMIVNRGIGSAGVKMRLFCPPHAVLLTLRASSPRPLQTR